MLITQEGAELWSWMKCVTAAAYRERAIKPGKFVSVQRPGRSGCYRPAVKQQPPWGLTADEHKLLYNINCTGC